MDAVDAYFGQSIREGRQTRGWSQSRLQHEICQAAKQEGHAVGVTVQMISRWENGHKRPDDMYRRLLVEVLGLREQGDDVQRRDFLRRAGGVAASVVVGDVMGTEMLELASAMQPTGVTSAMLDHAERTVFSMHDNFAKVPPVELLPVVNQHLRATTSLLKAGQPVAYRRRLCSIAGHLAGFRAWLMFDVRKTGEADAWYETALQPAQEAGDDALAAWLLGARSVVAFDQGRARDTLDLVSAAHHHAVRTGHSPIVGWVEALKARAHAAVGESAPARVALQRAREHTWQVGPEDRRHGMDVSKGQLGVDYYEGSTLLALRDPAAARTAFNDALDAQGDMHLKGRAVVILHIAMTYAHEGDVDPAADLGAAAWRIPPELRIGPIEQRMRTLRTMLEPAADSAPVRQLNQLLADEQSPAIP
jgi:transcriptional regulator with XRE-family HTH domain